MSITAGQPGSVPTPASASQQAAHRPARSYAAQVVLRVIGNWGAVIGIIWLATVAFAAAFAPLLANSHPILWRASETWTSPMLRHLTAADTLLLGLAIALPLLLWLGSRMIAALVGAGVCAAAGGLAAWLVGGVLTLGPAMPLLVIALVPAAALLLAGLIHLIAGPESLTIPRRLLITVAGLMLVLPLALWQISPPSVVVHSQYREALADGSADFALKAPIPYSALDYQRDQPEARYNEPGAAHLMGTDRDGGDLFARMIHASRIALSIGFIATGIAVAIGVVVGGLMGYFSGLADLLGMRLVEIFNAIPTLFLLIAFVAFFGRNLYFIMVIIGLTSWMGYALFTRAEFLRLRQQEFVIAAQAAAIPLRSILFKHMLPNGMAPVLVSASFGVASAILLESVLSFIGLGVETSWGGMLDDAISSAGTFRWWIALYPGLAIFLTVYAFNLIGEALRDAIDPHTHED